MSHSASPLLPHNVLPLHRTAHKPAVENVARKDERKKENRQQRHDIFHILFAYPVEQGSSIRRCGARDRRLKTDADTVQSVTAKLAG